MINQLLIKNGIIKFLLIVIYLFIFLFYFFFRRLD